MKNLKDCFLYGTKWLRADFHLHTKSDSDFSYQGDKNDHASFAQLYVAQMESAGIGIGVITNHNKFNLEEFKALRKAAEPKNIFLVPGVEFSLSDGARGVHALIVFSDDWILNKEQKNYICSFLDAAFVGKTNYDCSPYPNSNFDLKGAVKKLDEFDKDYFVIMAHVDDYNGVFEELKGRNLDTFIDGEAFRQRVLALQKSRLQANRNRVGRIACVEGTDNANGGIVAIGGGNVVGSVPQKTYIKVGDFSLNALKYALRDYANRVRTGAEDVPRIRNTYVESIAFLGGKLDGEKICFSPELNSLIGIRGSGKSAVLEILRYALGISLNNSSADAMYKNDLIEFVLGSGGKVIVVVVGLDGKRYRVEKYYRQKENIYSEDGELLNVSIASVFREPIYFGQKDLSNKNIDFELDLLSRLVGNRMDEVRHKAGLKRAEIVSTILELRKSQNYKQEILSNEQEIKDKEYLIKLYQDKGVAEKLKQQTLFERDGLLFSRIRNALSAYKDEMMRVREEYRPFFAESIQVSELNEDLLSQLESALTIAKEGFTSLGDIIQKSVSAIGEIDKVLASFDNKGRARQEDFARIKRELDSDTLSPDAFIQLSRELEVARLKQKELTKIEQRRTKLKDLLVAQLAQLNELWNEEFQILSTEVSRINAAQSRLVISIEFKMLREKFSDKLKSVFRGTGITGNEYQKIVDNYNDFIEIYRNHDGLKEILSESRFAEFMRRFKEHADDLLTYRVEDKVSIEYNSRPIGKLSLGQRASALILFLLAQKDNDVLIIDQPEDDLDNQTIYDEVIKQMLALKGDMQFIFATHNPNIPVLGDSEKVVSFSFEDTAKIKVDAGTIDMTDVHEKIVSIMEGGQEAFDRRNMIYDIWR